MKYNIINTIILFFIIHLTTGENYYLSITFYNTPLMIYFLFLTKNL